MSALGVGIISAIVAGVTICLIKNKNTKGNEFQLYRSFYSYAGSNRTITLGIFTGKAGAEKALAEYKNKMNSNGLIYGTEKVVVNTFGGREGNTVYEWNMNNVVNSCVYFFTKKEQLDSAVA